MSADRLLHRPLIVVPVNPRTLRQTRICGIRSLRLWNDRLHRSSQRADVLDHGVDVLLLVPVEGKWLFRCCQSLAFNWLCSFVSSSRACCWVCSFVLVPAVGYVLFTRCRSVLLYQLQCTSAIHHVVLDLVLGAFHSTLFHMLLGSLRLFWSLVLSASPCSCFRTHHDRVHFVCSLLSTATSFRHVFPFSSVLMALPVLLGDLIVRACGTPSRAARAGFRAVRGGVRLHRLWFFTWSFCSGKRLKHDCDHVSRVLLWADHPRSHPILW